MWCHMGQFHDTLHLPQTSPSNLRKRHKSDGSHIFMLESFLSLFLFFYLITFVLLVVARTPQSPQFNLCTNITHLFFCLLPSSVACFVVYSFHHRCQKWWSSLSLQCQDKPRGFKNDIALGVFVSRQQQTQNALPSHKV